jgi:hypothetical protein
VIGHSERITRGRLRHQGATAKQVCPADGKLVVERSHHKHKRQNARKQRHQKKGGTRRTVLQAALDLFLRRHAPGKWPGESLQSDVGVVFPGPALLFLAVDRDLHVALLRDVFAGEMSNL